LVAGIHHFHVTVGPLVPVHKFGNEGIGEIGFHVFEGFLLVHGHLVGEFGDSVFCSGVKDGGAVGQGTCQVGGPDDLHGGVQHLGFGNQGRHSGDIGGDADGVIIVGSAESGNGVPFPPEKSFQGFGNIRPGNGAQTGDSAGHIPVDLDEVFLHGSVLGSHLQAVTVFEVSPLHPVDKLDFPGSLGRFLKVFQKGVDAGVVADT